jgi:hypothetical protein
MGVPDFVTFGALDTFTGKTSPPGLLVGHFQVANVTVIGPSITSTRIQYGTTSQLNDGILLFWIHIRHIAQPPREQLWSYKLLEFLDLDLNRIEQCLVYDRMVFFFS